MTEERIRVVIDDAELIDVLNRIDVASRKRSEIINLGATAKNIKDVATSRDVRNLLPTLTRAQRILVTQIPLARETLGVTFRARTLLAANPALAAAVAAIFIQKGIEQFQREQLMKNAELEDMIRNSLDISHRQFQELSSEQIGFASFLDQFESRFEEEVEEGNILELIRTTVRDLLLSFIPVVPDDGVEFTDPWSESAE